MKKNLVLSFLLLGFISLQAQDHQKHKGHYGKEKKHYHQKDTNWTKKSHCSTNEKGWKKSDSFRFGGGITGGNYSAGPGYFVSFTTKVFNPISIFGEVEHYKLDTSKQATRFGLEIPIELKCKKVTPFLRGGISIRNNDIRPSPFYGTAGLLVHNKNHGVRLDLSLEKLESKKLLALFNIGYFIKF